MGDKRTRRKRLMGMDKTETIKVNRTAYTKKHGHCESRRYGGDLVDNSFVECERKQYSFDEEYKTYRRTRGRRGLAPNPDKRQDENPAIRLYKSLSTYCGRFPIGQLMEYPIGRL
jgi:hypothetical protein